MRVYFSGLLGNEDTKARVGRAIESGTVPHAFLIGGPSGSGKSVLATEIAAAVNCEAKGHLESELPCRKCESCRRIFEGNYPDVKILAKPKDKASLGVDPVKDFREDMFLSSTESEHKIYIIDDAESMTTEAQNALLKVLEEPPKSVMIIMLAKEGDRILTTIKSRAQYIAMTRFDDDELAKILLSESAEARSIKVQSEDRFISLIKSADGRLGLAKRLLNKKQSEDAEEDRADIIRLISAIGQKASYADIYAAVSHFPTKRADLSITLERVMIALRDLLVIEYDDKAKTLFFSSADEARRSCPGVSAKRIISVYDAIDEAHELCARNANISNLLCSLCSNIKSSATS